MQILAFLMANLSQPGVVAVTDRGLYYNLGEAFIPFPDLPQSGVQGFAASGKNMLVGTTNGLYVSHDYGYSFAKAPEPLGSAAILAVAADPVNGEFSVATSGIYYHSSDGGRNLSPRSSIPATPVSISSFNRTILLCTTATGANKVFLSRDQGGSFTAIGDGSAATCNRILYLENQSTGTGTILVSGSSGILVSSNNGATWSGPITTAQGLVNNSVNAVAITEGGIAYVASGTAAGGIAKSAPNNLLSFSATSVTGYNISDVAAADSLVIGCSTSGLFVSQNSASSFVGPISNVPGAFAPASCSRVGFAYVSIKTLGF